MHVDTFEQLSGPNSPLCFNTATAMPLDFFLIAFQNRNVWKNFQPHKQLYAEFKRDEIRTKNNEPEYADPRWSDTSVPEMRALFGINILMGISTLLSITCTGIKISSLAMLV